MKQLAILATVSIAVSGAAEVPQTVEETWASFDARAEPLEVELIREWRAEGITFRQLRFLVGSFKGKKLRVAAFYAWPAGGKDLPGIVQLHGGGQRAQSETVRYWASQGYAAIAVNWGENTLGDDGPEIPNTDWAGVAAGFLDPKHHNPVTPGEATLFDVAHPWNSSWLLYSAAGRRAITFLERQPEVDGARIGLTGHSMGGRLTVLTAIDPRVKAASPSVGGSGYLYDDITGVPGSARRMAADRDLYLRTLECRHYWPLIECPLLFLGATNDFNSPMEKVMQGFRSLPGGNGGLSFTPHLNHRFTADNYAARVRWFDTHLKGEFKFPGKPRVALQLEGEDGVPRFTVTPDSDSGHALLEVRVYYGFERDPRVRFWRSAEVVNQGNSYHATCPVADLGEPLFVFANVTYDTREELVLPRGFRPSSLLTVSSESRVAYPAQLRAAGVRAAGERSRLIDDFAGGWGDWALVSPDNAQHFDFKTHKLNDPEFRGPRGAALAFTVTTTAPGNTLAVIMETDQWRGYTGRKLKRYVALAGLPTAGTQQIELPMDSFVSADGEKLAHYDYVTGLILRPGDKEQKIKKPWAGKVPVLANLRWVGGEFGPQPRPYLGEKGAAADADAAFREQFDREVRESVEREGRDQER